MIQIVKSYEIKGVPREHLVDCLMAHKKDTLLEIANNHSVSVKKSHTKKVIVAELSKQIIDQFDQAYLLLKDDEKNKLQMLAKKGNAENLSIQETTQLNLQAKGYVYFFAENQHINLVVPVEIAGKVTQQFVQPIKEEEWSVAHWFLKTKEAVESIYTQCSVSHLTKAWNKHAAKKLTNDEAEQFFN